MSDDQVQELSPASAGSSLEERVPFPIEARVIILPRNPPSDPVEVRGLGDFKAWPSEVSVPAVKPAKNKCCFIDDSEIGLSIEVEETENESKSESKKENESGSGRSAALDVQADQAGGQLWPEEEEIFGFLHFFKISRKGAMKEGVKHSSMLGILNIPAMVTRDNLHNFLAPFQEVINEVKIIKDTTPSRYMALIKFNGEDTADTFYAVYNGCSFNQKDSEVCQLVYVGRFEVLKSGGRASFPMKNLTELPRCTICLERTGESMRGIFTWLCDQSFQGQSYQSPNDTMCPVCSYCHMPQQEQPRCLECGIRKSLRICLICGLIACGQDVRGHADQHFEETKHAYGMQLNDHKVWDYIEHNYVQPATYQSSSNMGQYRKEAKEKKIGVVQPEYSYLLSNQLESQQLFWEQKIIQLQKESNEEINNMKAKLASTIEKCNKLECEINDLLKEKQAVEKKCTYLNTKVSKLSTELKEEQEINKSLKANQLLLQNQLKEEEKVLMETCEQIDLRVTEMHKQLQDIIFCLESQQEVSDLSAESIQEIQEGQISVAMDVSASSPQEEEL